MDRHARPPWNYLVSGFGPVFTPSKFVIAGITIRWASGLNPPSLRHPPIFQEVRSKKHFDTAGGSLARLGNYVYNTGGLDRQNIEPSLHQVGKPEEAWHMETAAIISIDLLRKKRTVYVGKPGRYGISTIDNVQ